MRSASGVGIVLKIAAVVLLAALSGCRWWGHGGSVPPAFTYAAQVLTVNVPMTPASPTPAASGTGTTYALATGTTLPAGLVLSASTGVITGTPTTASAATTYNVVARNARGTRSASISIAVNPPAPASFSYAALILTTNTAMAPASPTPAATAGTSYAASASTPLPAGLSVSASTGTISGTPTAVSAASSYTITATNAGGSTPATVTITVNPPAPAAFTYAAQSLAVNVAMTPAGPTPATGGATYALAASTTLPAGLSLNASTGVISGTPTAASAATTYGITASTAGGTTASSITITVSAGGFGVKQGGGAPNLHSRAYGVSTNASGSIYIAGDSDEPLSGTSPVGAIDIILSKFNAAGTPLYTRRIGAANTAGGGWSTASDAQDNVYVTGYTNCAWPACSQVQPPDTQVLSVTLPSDLVLNKYDALGNLLWAKQIGSTRSGVAAVNTSHFVVTDQNAVYIAGHTGGDLANAHTGNWDMFVIKYDAVSQAQLWAVQLGVAGANTEAWALAEDSAGNIYTAGNSNGDFGGTRTGTQDVVFAKFNASGTLQYTRLQGAAGAGSSGFGIASDGSPTGSVWVAGLTCGGMDGNTLSGTGACDLFLTQYDAATGNKIHTTQMGSGAGFTITRSVATDAAGNVYVTGYTPGPVFDGQTVTGVNDMFLTKFDKNGVKQFTRLVGTASQSTQAYSVTTDASGNVFVAGYVVIGGASSPNTKHYFLMKFNANGVAQ